MTIDIVVPVYLNHLSLYPIIQRFFDSLKKHYPGLPIIAIDDASPLPLPEDWPITYRNIVNLGYTKTVNFGIRFSGADLVIVANDDLTFKPGDLDRYLGLPPNTIASPRDTASSPDDLFGSIWGARKDVFATVGLLDENLKHFYSDRDYYDRAKKAGVDVIKWEDIVVDHIESATYKNIDKEKLLQKDLETYLKKQG